KRDWSSDVCSSDLLDLWCGIAEQQVSLALIPSLDRLPHDLHVRLRHRLLRQPYGFEGFVPCPVLPNAHDLAVVDRKHMRLFSFQRHPAASSRNVGGKWHDHNVAKVDELLSLQGEAFIPNIKQRGDELPDAFVADVR